MKKRPRSEAETRKRIEAAKYCCGPFDPSYGGTRDVRLIARWAYEREHGARHYHPITEVPPGEGRTCAVVGNARSILDRLDGEVIDSHDVIVRINTPTIQSAGCQGHLLHYLFVTAVSMSELNINWPIPYGLINISEPAREFVERWSEVARGDTGDISARPTTGFVAIMYMHERGYNVNIFGFDWFKTPSLSAIGATPWQHHYPEWERVTVGKTLGIGDL